jgi:hypothetical protein
MIRVWRTGNAVIFSLRSLGILSEWGFMAGPTVRLISVNALELAELQQSTLI